MSKTIYIDESGYSGSNFVDDKLIFTVASLGVDPDEADDLKARFFGAVRASELKHTQLVRRPRGRAAALALLSELAARGAAKVWLADKRYAAWLKVVDFIVEPFVYEKGGNIYRDGANYALASMLHYCLPAFGSPDIADRIITASMTFLKSGTAADRQSLKRILETAAKRFPNADDLLSLIKMPLQALPPDLFAPLPLQRSDLAFGAALQLMAWWRSETDAEIHVIHDQTANMSRRKDIWDAITDRELKPFEDQAASGLAMKFPIAVSSTTFAPSDKHAGLQLTDVLAGAIGCCVEASGTGSRAEYAQSVLERIDGISIHALIPSKDMSPEGMGTAGRDGSRSLEYLTERLGEMASTTRRREPTR